ncbi:hypothetical protein [Klebsiella quasipneumoniae]|uniref:hypothetical protein n=1 Tax=Klebsiella quasipneumoniae TaxID=1463165 RepID=UPI001865B1DD|nr:hypothetical protein [Klebsiella quasipneumoniae]
MSSQKEKLLACVGAHEFERVFKDQTDDVQLDLAGFVKDVATALKPTHEAGRRGGESTARQSAFSHLFSQPERVAVPRRFALVSVGGVVMSEGVAGF